MQIDWGVVFENLQMQLQAAMNLAINGTAGGTLHINFLSDILQAIGQILSALFG